MGTEDIRDYYQFGKFFSYDEEDFEDRFREYYQQEENEAFEDWENNREKKSSSLEYVRNKVQDMFPGENFAISDRYHGVRIKRLDTWYVEPDSSIDPGGAAVWWVGGNRSAVLSEVHDRADQGPAALHRAATGRA